MRRATDVQLEALDTDQIANDEAVAVEQLLAAGWEIDLDRRMTRSAPVPLLQQRQTVPKPDEG